MVMDHLGWRILGKQFYNLPAMRSPMTEPLKWKNTPALPGKAYHPTTLEQIANCVTHVPFVPLSIFGMLRLYSKATSWAQLSTAVVYGLAVCCLFVTSSSFHLCSLLARDSRLRSVLHLCDRVVIYLFIAASYTPWFALREFHSSWGQFTLWFTWISAIVGIAFQCIYHERCKWLETSIYLTVGLWPSCIIVYMEDWSGLHLVFLGGIIYVLGLVFFKLDGRVPMAHAIWHCFVLVGAFLHYCAIDSFLIID